MLAWYRRSVRRLGRFLMDNLWLVILGLVIAVALLVFSMRPEDVPDPRVLDLTLNAASTQENVYLPTLAASLTQTPVIVALTEAAPTLALSGRQEVRQFAASAGATSERDTLNQGAIQAAGPPNTSECGDFRTAWASATPNEVAALTLLFPELVTPTGLRVYESYNPGFITRITFTDIYGKVHLVYEAPPGPQALCPFVLVVAIVDADFKGNMITIEVDQRTSLGGWDQIDAVELIGIKH